MRVAWCSIPAASDPTDSATSLIATSAPRELAAMPVLAEASEPLTVAIRSTRSATEVTIARRPCGRVQVGVVRDVRVRGQITGRGALGSVAERGQPRNRRAGRCERHRSMPGRRRGDRQEAGPLYPRCTATAATAIVAIRSPCDRVARR